MSKLPLTEGFFASELDHGEFLVTQQLACERGRTDADAVDMRRFNSESGDATREDIHDDHHPETLQQDGLSSKQIEAPQAVAGFSDG